MSGGAPTKRDKKLNYELELFEQNLEDLLASETGQTTTVTVGSGHRGVGASGGVLVPQMLTEVIDGLARLRYDEPELLDALISLDLP